MPAKEIGWKVIKSADLELIPAGPRLDFHGDHCLPPPEATILATSDRCVQAFAASGGIWRCSSIRRSTGISSRAGYATGPAARPMPLARTPTPSSRRRTPRSRVAAVADRLVASALRVAAQAAAVTPRSRRPLPSGDREGQRRVVLAGG